MALIRLTLWDSDGDVLINTNSINQVRAGTGQTYKYPSKTMLLLTLSLADRPSDPIHVHAVDDQGDPDLQTFNDVSELGIRDATKNALRAFQGLMPRTS